MNLINYIYTWIEWYVTENVCYIYWYKYDLSHLRTDQSIASLAS